MKGNEIRSKFLEYFEKNAHTIVESSSLVPKDDPTLLFTNAGMVQFKTVFMGEDKRDYVRAVTSQRCVRAGGKHNDLENVGYTARHHTFFEMLGNFSFGNYFKEDAIRFAWDFLTVELKIRPENLWVSIFDDDDEAYALWEKVEDLPKGRIVRMGEKDNFWAMGDTGPCGPCSEIHIDQGAAAGCGSPDCKLGCDCDRFLELWNLVFMQFNRSEDGTMTPLPKPSIDTGMGLERVAAVLQGKYNNYDSDLFLPIIKRLEKLSGKTYGEIDSVNVAMRVIADHARATTFLVADGVLPSNEGRGYVLRRIMRRAVRYGKNLGLDKPFMEDVTDAVVAAMADAYPHLLGAVTLLKKVVNNEEERFRETLEHGLLLLDEKIAQMKDGTETVIDGEFIFKLYDTFGFPFDIVRDIALEKKVGFDESGFLAAMDAQRSKSRASRKGEGVRLKDEGVKSLAEKGLKSEFTGYNSLTETVTVDGLIDGEGKSVSVLAAGDGGRVFFTKTPFYAESGGQLGDRGQLRWQSGSGEVFNTMKEGEGLVLHEVRITEGSLALGQTVELTVAKKMRRATAANHSATHLLQAALIKVLGDHVKQSGSLVGPERLRFDFTHFSPMTEKELEQVEVLVNDAIRDNMLVETAVLAKEDAIQGGATALFGEKYDDHVRVVSMGDFSRELCGGTHVGASGEIGLFKILSESGIAAGVRRIEAIAGEPAFMLAQDVSRRERRLSELLNARDEEIVAKVEAILANQKKLEKQIGELAAKLASSDLDSILQGAIEIAGVRVLAAEIPLDSPKTLRDVGDKIRDTMGSAVAVLGGEVNGKVALLAIVSKDLTGKVKAGDIVGKVAQVVGGKGGGRPDMAQAGGPMVDKLTEAIGQVPKIVESLLGN
ncbi:alanine--tRNA ligase [Desulfopila aestuarii]|uniref:Alanine--tRNA ligase n=1 Tax=Desulfopila aestuarii DSM 18488 TaxID=1121416 RepID=A0A1M7Y321_9BACT|nr:alanine--tRNA ligase [Desulfopila aestuarii]SHO46159.1 alanyl-tRNA synthetase [Desulfopila aestuarii DSM 18488]